MRLFDPALNTNPAQAEGVSVEMWSRIAGDFELLGLDETGPSTDVFEGQLRLTTDWYASGALRTSNSGAPDYQQDQIYVRSGASEATARVVPAQIEFLDAFGRKTSVYAAGETVRLRVEDHYKSPYLDVFPVVLVSLQTGDSETVNVQETGPGTGIFVGSIATALYGGVAADGRLGVDLLETIEARFTTNVNQAEITGQADDPRQRHPFRRRGGPAGHRLSRIVAGLCGGGERDPQLQPDLHGQRLGAARRRDRARTSRH